jgi:hypothetical protein
VSGTFDRTLIDPTPAERDTAQLERSPEGMRGWHGGKKPDYWEGRSQVAVAW